MNGGNGTYLNGENMYTKAHSTQSDGLTAEIKMVDRRNGQVDRPHTAQSKSNVLFQVYKLPK